MSSVVQGAALAASFAARIAKRARVKAANVKSVHHRDEEKLECLDWLDHDWVKPSLTKSMAHRSRYVCVLPRARCGVILSFHELIP